MSKLSLNFGVAAFSRLLLGGISLIVVGLLTRTLGPAGYGQYSLVFAYHFIFTALADLGLYTILVREISRPQADERKIVSNIFGLRLTAVVSLLAVAILAVQWLPYPTEVKLGILIASLFSIGSSLVQVLTGVFQKYLKLYYVSVADVVSRLVQLFLLILVVNYRPGLLPFIWVVAVSEIIHFALVFVFARRLVPVGLAADLDYWQGTFKKSLPIAVSLVFVLLYFKLDTILLSLFKPAYDVGVYSVAYKILELIIFLPAMYIGLVMPLLSRQAPASTGDFLKTFRKSFNVLAIFALPAMAYLALRAEDIIRLISGSEFGPSVRVLQILSVAIMLIFFGNLGGNAVVALDLQKQAVKIYFLGAILNIGGNLLLIPRYSYFATAWTTVLTELFITLGLFWLIRNKIKFWPDFRILAKAALATILIVFLVHPLRLEFAAATALALLYFPILYLFKGFNRADLKEMISRS
ncbi:MAG: flippase [Patescibacteria group bacterium]